MKSYDKKPLDNPSQEQPTKIKTQTETKSL